METKEECEQMVLGGILLDSSFAHPVTEILDVDDFYYDNHRQIFSTIKELVKRNEPVDIVSILETVHNPYFDKKYLMDVVNSTPNADNTLYYAKKVKELSNKRKIKKYLTHLDYSQSIDSLVYNVRSFLTNIHNTDVTPTLDKDVDLDELERLASSKTFHTHFPTLNDCIRIAPGHLITVVGDTSRGKTTFALNLMYDIAQEGGTIQFFTLDMEKYQLLARIASMVNGAEKYELLPDNEHFVSRILEAQSTEFAKHIILEEQTPYISDIIAKIHTTNPDVVVIDYVQNVKMDDERKNVFEKLSHIMIAIQLEAHDRPIIVLSQVSKGEGDEYMKRAKGSSTIAQASSIVIEVDKSDNTFKYRIAKNRSIIGRTTDWVNLDFHNWMLAEEL